MADVDIPDIDTPIFGEMSWSPTDNHLILTNSTGSNPETTVTLVITNASSLGNGWTVRAKTSRSRWRNSDWVSLNTDSDTTEIPIVLGTDEVSSFGDNKTFIMKTQAKSPEGRNYTNSNTLSCEVTNYYGADSSQIHVNASWLGGNKTFSLPTDPGTDDTGVNRTLFWDVVDTGEIQDVSAATDLGSIRVRGPNFPHIVDLGGILRYYFVITIKSSDLDDVSPETSVSSTFTITMDDQTSSFGDTLNGIVSLYDNTAPVIDITQNDVKTMTRYSSDTNFDNSIRYTIKFTISDEHSSVVAGNIVGNEPYVACTATTSDTLDVADITRTTVKTFNDNNNPEFTQLILITDASEHAPAGGSVTHTYTIFAEDTAGNIGSKNAYFTLNRYDNVAPEISAVSHNSLYTFNSNSNNYPNETVQVTFDVTDDIYIINASNVTVIKKSTDSVGGDDVNISGTTNMTMVIPVNVESLQHNDVVNLEYDISAQDLANPGPNVSNTTTISFNVKLNDNRPTSVINAGSTIDFLNSNDNNTKLTAFFSVSDRILTLDELVFNVTSGWDIQKNYNTGIVSVSKTIDLDSYSDDSVTVELTARKYDTYSSEASHTFDLTVQEPVENISPTSITVTNNTSGTVDVSANFYNFENDIDVNGTQIVDASGNNLQNVSNLITQLSNDKKNANVTATLSYNYNDNDLIEGNNKLSIKIGVSDLIGNIQLSDDIDFTVTKENIVSTSNMLPTLSQSDLVFKDSNSSITELNITESDAVLIIEFSGDSNLNPSLIKNGETSPNAFVFNNDDNVYTWEETIYQIDYEYGTTEDTYGISITIGEDSTSISKVITVVKNDNTKPIITLESLEAFEITDGVVANNPLSVNNNNQITLYTDPDGSQPHNARLKITARITDDGGLISNPVITGDSNGWSLSTDEDDPDIYVWKKDVSSIFPVAYQIITRVNAVDICNNIATPKIATFNIITIDNTKPSISDFEMSGIVKVNEIPTITLKESTLRENNNTTQDATIKLKWSDNGSTGTPEVKIDYGTPTIMSETLTASVTNLGENIYYKSFGYEDFTSILPLGQTIPVTITATVTDTSYNLTSDSLTANLQLIDDTLPLISTYSLFGSDTSLNRLDLSFNNNEQYEFVSSNETLNNNRLFLEANVIGEDVRGISKIDVSSNPALYWVEDSSGIFHADIGFNDLGQFSTNYIYNIIAKVEDNFNQVASSTKTIILSKRDDGSAIGNFGSISGLTDNETVFLKSSDPSEKTLRVDINVNEDTIGTRGTAELTGTYNPTIQLVGVQHTTESTRTRVYSYDVTLHKDNYGTQGTTSETLFFNITQPSEELTASSGGITKLINVEFTEDGEPAGSISSAADSKIDGGINMVNLTTNLAQLGYKIYIYANFSNSMNSNTIGIIGGDVNLTFYKFNYNATNKQAVFVATVTSAFYSSLTKNDEYEYKTFTVTGLDVNESTVSMDITIGFKRSNVSPTEITNFSLSDTCIVHLDSDTEEKIDVLLFAEVSGESGLSDQYVTYTKNGVEQPNVRLPSDFTGSWSQLLFESFKPNPFDPGASDDVYVFTLHCVDLNNQKSTAEATLTVKYGNADDPIIYNANFYEDDAVITQKYISVTGYAAPFTIQETVQFKTRIADLNDNINQLTVELNKEGELSNSAITEIKRKDDNEVIDGNDYAVFDVTLETNSDWKSSLQPITVLLTVDDTQGNSVNVTRNLNIAIGDEPPPVISSLTLECFGQNGNNLVADSNANHKAGIVRGEMIAYSNSGLDISSVSLVTSDDREFTYFSNEPDGTIDGYSATKIIFNLMVNYDDSMLDFGENTLTATARIQDTLDNEQTLDASCSIVKLDQLAPQILGLAFVEENVTSVKDNGWSSPINITDMEEQKSLSSWIIINTTIPNPIQDQVLLSVGGEEDEYTLIMAIKNETFIVHAGLNKDEAVRNNSAVMLLNMNDTANPLHQFMGSIYSVELALLVRLDIGVIMLYANGRLIAAEQARERSFVAYGGSTPTLSVGNAGDANNRSVHADISGNGIWLGTIQSYNIYDWSSVGSNKVLHESSEVNANVSTNKTSANGKVVFANLDNEETTLSFKENNVDSTNQVSTFANVSTFDKSIAYNDQLGNDTQDIPYVVSSAQIFDNSYSDLETLAIRKINTDEEAPVINDFVITHETATSGSTIIDASDVIVIGSSTEKFLITIDASDNALDGVDDTKTFIIKLGNATISSTKSGVSNLEYEFELNWDILNQITNVKHHGNHNLAISATVVDHASNESRDRNENLTIRTVDEEPPVITGAVFNTVGLVTNNVNLENDNDNLVIYVSISNASPSAEVDMTVKFTDNSHYLTESSISIDASGSVYTGGPSVWTGSNDLPRGFTVTSFDASNGNYEATIKRTFAYSELSSKGSHQYRTGENEENWTVTVTDNNNQTNSKNFKINVSVVDDVFPILPSIELNTNNIELGPGEEQNVVATITTGDDYGISVNGVNLLSSLNSNSDTLVNDIAVLVNNATINDVTLDNPSPANKKVFTASFDVSYTDLTGDYSTAKEYYIGASITDLALQKTTNNSATILRITRKDTEAPKIDYIKRTDNAPEYNTYSELLLNDASYNVVSISTAASVPDLRFTITDNDAINPTTIKMYQSQPIEDISTNTSIQAPQNGVYNGATEISINFADSAYEPETPISFNPNDFSNFYIDGYSYYVWIRVEAEDMAENKTELHIPFNINKLDATNPEAAVSVNTTQRNGATEVNGVSSGFTTHEDHSQVIANLRSDSTDAIVQIIVEVSDNHEVKSVFATPIGTTIKSAATGPFVIDGVTTYTIERVYSIEDYNHVGNKLVDDFNVVIEDKTGNTKKHRIPVYINSIDVTAPSINVTMSANTNELKFSGDQLTISVNAEITDAGSDILVDSVQLVDASEKGYIEKGLVASGTYEWTKTIDWSDTGELSTIIIENIEIKASDNNNNEQSVYSSLQYIITNNSDIESIIRKTLLQEDEQETIIVETVKSINPSQIYNIVFQWEITDSINALVGPTNSDVVITGDGTHSLANDVTMENTGNIYTYRAIVALDTNQLVKGQISSISLELTTKNLNSIEEKYTITQQFYVWDYDTIDLVNDYYIMYDANINNTITRVKNIDDSITGYKITARSTAFTNVNTVQVNYPTGNALVEVEPFEIIKYAKNSDTDIEETYNFKVHANVYADSNGTVEAETFLEDKTVTISYVDDYTLAQVMYSNMQHSDPDKKPTVIANTADHITRTYGPDYFLNNHISRAAISSRVVDQGLLASSPPSIGIVDLNEITSQLDQIAQRNGTFGEYNIMQEGDMLVLSLSESNQPSYQRIVSDICGNQIEVVASTPIKLVLRQRTGARSI